MTKTVFQYATCILGMVFMVLGAIAFGHPATEQLPPSFLHGLLLIVLGLQLIGFWDRDTNKKTRLVMDPERCAVDMEGENDDKIIR